MKITNGMRPARRWLGAAALALGAVLLAACGGGGGSAGVPASGDNGGGAVGGTTPGATSASVARGPIAGLGSIIVNGVRYDDSGAKVEDDDGRVRRASELRLGMTVEVQGSAIDDSSARATASSIRFGAELLGPVAAKDAGAGSFTMLDQVVEVKPTTVFDGLAGFAALTVGQLVEVHAQFDAASGHYVATRIEREDSAAGYLLRGTVSALDTSAKTFKIGAALVDYGKVAASALPALADGLKVRVRLQATAGAPWIATAVSTGVRKMDNSGDARLRGLVNAFTSPQAFEVQGIAVDASAAVFEPGAAAVRLGVMVDVRGRAADGKVLATRVKVRHEGEDEIRRVELHGLVSALDATKSTFTLREVTVDYSRVTQWKDGSAADLANGRRLEVKGTWSDDRSVLFAATIEFER